jgi:hypothetical protein
VHARIYVLYSAASDGGASARRVLPRAFSASGNGRGKMTHAKRLARWICVLQRADIALLLEMLLTFQLQFNKPRHFNRQGPKKCFWSPRSLEHFILKI